VRRLAPFVFTLLLVGPIVCPPAARAASIASRTLIDPTGEYTGDNFGCSVAWVGDVNRDGYDDVLIGAFRYPENSSLGQAYLYFGGPGMDAVADLVIPAPAGNTAWFGAGVASAGDFNGDGYPDFIVGAPQSGFEGKAFIYYGGPSLDATPDVTLIGESTGSLTLFGASVASAGDVNGDGFDDVIVGAPHFPGGGNLNGRAYVFFGGISPDAVPDVVLPGLAANDQLGTVVGSAGDMNGDGYADVFASAPFNDAAALNAGEIEVWFGGLAMDATADLRVLGSGVNERLQNAANAGDVNGDGYSDLIGAGQNQVRVWFGGPSPNSVSDVTLGRAYASVAGAGDVNGDGIDDFVVGAPLDVMGGVAAGRVSIFFGGSPVDTVDDLYYVGDHSGRELGLGVAAGGHVDGPGPSDVIASSYEDPEQIGYNKGRVYVFANTFATAAVPATANPRVEFVGVQPNPAWNDVQLAFVLEHTVPVRVTVYDLAGHEVARPVENEWLAGRVTRTWRPRVPSGIYYVRAKLGDHEYVRKVAWLGTRR
jgi:hypothetical protein